MIACHLPTLPTTTPTAVEPMCQAMKQASFAHHSRPGCSVQRHVLTDAHSQSRTPAAARAQGAFQYAFYTRVLGPLTEPVTRSMGHIASAPLKTLLDQGFHHPFLYFPAFYLLKYSLVQGDPPATALKHWREELFPNCKALWCIWVCERASALPRVGTSSCGMLVSAWDVRRRRKRS